VKKYLTSLQRFTLLFICFVLNYYIVIHATFDNQSLYASILLFTLLFWIEITLYSLLLQKKRAYKELGRFQQLTDLSPIPIIIYRDGKISYMNDKALSIMEYSSLTEVVNKSLIEIVHPTYKELALELTEFLLKHNLYIKPIEKKFITATGKIIDVEVMGVYHQDSDQNEIQLVFQDITEKKLHEQKLKYKNEQINEILESISDAFYAVDHEWNFTYVNKAAETILDIKRENLQGKNLWTEFPNSKSLKFFDQYFQAVTQQKPVRFEEYSPTYHKWFSVSAFPSQSGLSIYLQDITDKKKYDLAIKESNERLNRIMDLVPSGLIIMNREGSFTYVNSMSEEILEMKKDEMLGKTYKDLNVGTGSLPSAFNQTMTMKHASSFNNLELYLTYPLKDNKILSVSGAPFIDENGDISERIYSFIDITKSKRANQELVNKSTKLKAIFNNPAIGIALIDIYGNLIEGNQRISQITGYEEQELSILSPFFFLGELMNKQDLKTLLNEDRKYFQYEKKFLKKGNELVWGKITVTLVKKTEDLPPYLIFLIEDITQSKETELENLEKDAELRLLQAQINPHFLFNTLNLIMSLIRIEPELAKHLTGQLSHFMRFNLQITNHNLITLQDEMTHLTSYLEIIKARFDEQLIILVDCQVDVKKFVIPPCTIQPLVENSIQHGLKSKAEGGVITIKLTTEGEFARIVVSDNGIGIHEELLPYIGKEIVKSKEGNGTGLFNVNKRLSSLLGKNYELDIRNRDIGSDVSFIIPCVKGDVTG